MKNIHIVKLNLKGKTYYKVGQTGLDKIASRFKRFKKYNYEIVKVWELDYDNLYLNLNDEYAIRITKVKCAVWFEVDQSPLLDGCYLFSSQDLKETLDWCYDNLNIELMYY